VIPIPLWKDVKDLQEWETYRQRRPETGDKHSAFFEQVTEGIHAFPGGFALATPMRRRSRSSVSSSSIAARTCFARSSRRRVATDLPDSFGLAVSTA